MKIIFSPSKSQHSKLSIDSFPPTKPLFFNKAEQLRTYLSQYSSIEIEKIFKVSKKKSDEIVDDLKKEQKNQVAISLFNGTSFKKIDLHSFSKDHYDFIQSHLRILSAMYGVLRPFDAVLKYRLDMNDKIFSPNNAYKNLYSFWEEDISNYFKNEEKIINLASGEYSKMLKGYDSRKIISIYFLVIKDGKEKSVSVYSKQQRGNMLAYMMNNFITEPVLLKKYSDDGFVFNQKKSDSNNYYFIKS